MISLMDVFMYTPLVILLVLFCLIPVFALYLAYKQGGFADFLIALILICFLVWFAVAVEYFS